MTTSQPPAPCADSDSEAPASEASTSFGPLAWAALGVLLLHGVVLRAVDLDPASLWLDDAWVAVLSRSPHLSDVFTHGSSSPPLFNLLIVAFTRLLSDPELSAQALPFACSLLAIPLTALTTFRLTRSRSAALLAAAVFTYHPTAIVMAARVKQYSSDALVATLHVLACAAILRAPTPRRLWAYTAFASLSLLLSNVSLFLTASFAVPTWIALYRRDDPPPHRLPTACTLALALAAVYLLVVAPNVNPALTDYWRDHYLPTDSLHHTLTTLSRMAAHDLGLALHVPNPSWTSPVLLVGLALTVLGLLELRACAPPLAAALLLLAGGLVVTSAAGRFPLASGRVVLFLVPLLALTLGAGWALLQRHRTRWLLPALALCALFVLPPAPTPSYPPMTSAPLVHELAERLTPDDQVWVNSHSTYALGYYGPWSLTFRHEPALGTGYVVEPQGVDVRVFLETPPPIGPDTPDRIHCVFFASYRGPAKRAVAALRAAGYTLTTQREAPLNSLLLQFDRT